MKPFELIISPTGEMTHLYDPELVAETSRHGTVEISRASHVDPGRDMRPEALERLYEDGCKYVDRDAVGIPDLILHLEYLDRWWADMLPVEGPVLGPFDTRDEGLAAELQWLSEHNLQHHIG